MANTDEKSTSAFEEWTSNQQKLFEQYKEFLDEVNNLKLLKMFGDDCKEAYVDCLKLQEELFDLWKESLSELPTYNSANTALKLSNKNYHMWQKMLDTQEKYAKKWVEEMKKNENKFGSNFIPNPDKALALLLTTSKLYENCFKMMNETFYSFIEEKSFL